MVQNDIFWQVGCLGITETCNSQCEESFIDCVNEKNETKAIKIAKAFATCIDEDTFGNLEGCTVDCSPSFNMLSASETPTKYSFDRFGAPEAALSSERPEESHCMIEN